MLKSAMRSSPIASRSDPLILRMILSEKSATFRDHALAHGREKLQTFGAAPMRE